VNTRLSTREHLLIFAFWTGLAVVSAINRLLDAPGFIRVMSPAGPVILAFLEAWIWAGATPFIFGLSSRFSLERKSWWVRLPLLILTAVVVSIIIYLLIDTARDLLIDIARPRRRMRNISPWAEIARFRFVNQLAFFFAVLAAGYAREYFLRDRARGEQLAEAQLNALRMQLNPHFIFNTLNAISALVERDPAGVRRMIARLSELLRYTTDKNARDLIPLREELDFLRRYVEIMEIRFQGRLRVTIGGPSDALEVPVPNLILQPIVENALEHGASRAEGAGEVAIVARLESDRLVVTVRDNGPGPDQSPQRTGIGLTNTRARLAQIYGDAAHVTLATSGEGGAVAELVIPHSNARR
jgi:two-component system, LytTR family, sensor kinase